MSTSCTGDGKEAKDAIGVLDASAPIVFVDALSFASKHCSPDIDATLFDRNEPYTRQKSRKRPRTAPLSASQRLSHQLHAQLAPLLHSALDFLQQNKPIACRDQVKSFTEPCAIELDGNEPLDLSAIDKAPTGAIAFRIDCTEFPVEFAAVIRQWFSSPCSFAAECDFIELQFVSC